MCKAMVLTLAAVALGFFLGASLAVSSERRVYDTLRARDAFHLADRWRVRVYEDGSARVSYRVKRMGTDRYVRVTGGVGVPW